MTDALQTYHDAVNARALVDNPVFQTVFAEIEAEITEAWKTSESPTERESQWQKLKALQSLRMQLQTKINLGQTLEHRQQLISNGN